MYLSAHALSSYFTFHSDLLESELLYMVAAVAELLVGELRRREEAMLWEFLTGLLQEHWEALGGHENSAQFLIQDLSPTSPISKFG